MKVYSTHIITITKYNYLHAQVNERQIIIDFINQVLIVLIDNDFSIIWIKKIKSINLILDDLRGRR